MLPIFEADGLVITREQDTYQVGDVVAYHNQQLNAVVLHRIVARDGERYVFKGDNNNFRDQYHAAPSDLVGEEWVYWAGAGEHFRRLRSPLTFGVIIGLIALVAVRAPKRSRRRRRHHAR